MSDDRYSRVVTTKEHAHEAAKVAYAHAQALIANGQQVALTCEPHKVDRTLLQNAYYWAACLREISEQASILGQRYTADAWHELFKRQILGFEVVKVEVAGRKKPVYIRRLRSTTDLSVRAMSNYLDEVQAFAATELGVRFTVRDWYEHAGIARPVKKSTKQAEPVAEPA